MVNNSSTIRVLREIKELQTGSDLSLAVAHREDDVRTVRCLIVGPSDTPYEFGFFEFKAKFGDAYPVQPPSVRCLTTNGGRCRFNPNIYATGKVCLSILGTWRGEEGEQWSTAQGIESVLISIQSLMSSNPYENEPGFEHIKVTAKEAEAYAQKVRHETLRITVLQRLETLLEIADDDHITTAADLSTPPADYDDDGVKEYDPSADGYTESDPDALFHPFADLYKRRFIWYYDAYLKSIDDASAKIKDGTAFVGTPFEYGTNDMRGKFAYASLKTRFLRVYEALEAEKDSWATEGKAAFTKEHGTAMNLNHQFDSLRNHYSRSNGPSVELSLVDGNPFVWTLTFFGPSETDLYGATINVRLHFPFKFPDQQPRVTVLTPLFHHRISSTTKALCYFPTKLFSVQNHIESIMAAIVEENPSYDPRALVNPAASVLRWGDEAGKKLYRRKLRRSVQDAMENCDEF
ncbi:UBC-like protein [Aureobasidium pullulans EXF-150]|uniref:Ubiquitin-conjugating enzyme E2 Z n=1 Tax=Aureobasidium pullulans EXF-150 TaxID=1043002 RepID=A0A074XFJ6_AURPU|nr:UBC-like protein [Aureobasidium pullulans EXF-150]KEQ80832.1 UBC-like protein [Aureobasidium pullulans EXF-150]